MDLMLWIQIPVQYYTTRSHRYDEELQGYPHYLP